MLALVMLLFTFALAIPIGADASVLTGSFTIQLVISNISVSAISYNSATILWTTNGEATSQVFYDTISYANETDYTYQTAENLNLVVAHSVSLTGLSAGAIYHYRVSSEIPTSSLIAISDDYTLTTLTVPAPTSTATTKPDVPITTTTPESTGTTITPVATPTTAPATTPATTPTQMTLSQQGTTGSNIVFPTNVFLNNNGVSQTAGQIVTTDGDVTFNVAAGTQMLDSQGQPLTQMIASVPTSMPPPPPQDTIVASYDFGPPGATFVPPLTMILKYDLATLPLGMTDKTLYIAFWDGTQWHELTTTVNTTAKTVTALVPHFTDFAVLGQVATTTPITTPTSTHTPTSTPNWLLIIGIIVTVIVIVLIILFLIARKRRSEKYD